MDKICYLDNAATTKCFSEVADIFERTCRDNYFNPSAGYSKALSVKKLLEDSRTCLLNLLHGSTGKLLWTSSATESNNTVFSGVHLRAKQKVLISAGEHPSVFQSAHSLEKKGIIVETIPLNKDGGVDEKKFKELLKDESVALVSIIHVSNETGHINDIQKLVSIAKSVRPNVLFHSDGVQAFGKIKVNLNSLGVDLYTISAHKVYAPRGIAALWIKEKVTIEPLLYGGGQENGLRSSTENVAGAICFAFAAKKASEELEKKLSIVENIKSSFLESLKSSKIGEFLKINSLGNCSPYILSLSFLRTKGEVLMRAFEAEGVLISTGSACSSKKAGNRVLSAMGLSDEEIIGSVRVSFSPYEEVEISELVSKFEKVVSRFVGAK